MKRIVKNQEPAAFANWKAGAGSNWQPAFANMPSDIKDAVKRALMAEQGCICCYCEQGLEEDDSHIEHLVPQSAPDGGPLSLDYGNLLCSCLRAPAKGEPLHCGQAKSGWHEPDLMVSPLDADCESRFGYAGDGSIFPGQKGDPGAAATIKRLNLDIPKLRDLRIGAIEAFFLEGSLSMERLPEFARDCVLRNPDGSFRPFCTSIRYLFG